MLLALITTPVDRVPQQQPYLIATYPIETVKATEETTKYNKHTILKQEKSKLGFNCYQYAKSKHNLPHGMTSLSQKKSKIKTKEAEEGLAGVTAEGKYGHMIIVEKVKTESIVISEGNYRSGFITWREIPKSMVLGYL